MEQIEYRSVAGLVSLQNPSSNSTTKATVGTACGYAIRYGEPSHAMKGHLEYIEAGAATRSVESGDDISAIFEHETRMLLGRTSAGTLRLHEDNQGVYYEVDLPDTTVGRDLATLLKRGDITGSSFGFTEGVSNWSQNEHNYPVRSITDLKLHHISPVTTPAYPTATAEVRP